MSSKLILITGVLAVCTAAIYLPRLSNAPIYPDRDEVFTALTAQSLVSNGKDLDGRVLPLYFQRSAEFWFTPVLTYAVSATLRVLSFSEGAIRLPMVTAGIIDAILVFWIAMVLFDRISVAVVASGATALAPAHFVMSRLAMDNVAPLPFALGWLLCAVLFLKHGAVRLLFVGGLLLGIGVFSYLGAIPLMGTYLLLTCAVLLLKRASVRCYLVAILGFAIPVSVWLLWLRAHPSVLRLWFVHYQADASHVNSEDIFQTVWAAHNLEQFTWLYSHFWSPQFLFVDNSIVKFATRQVGAFLLPVAGLLVVASVRVLRAGFRVPEFALLAGGFLTAPVPASVVGVDAAAGGHAIWRALEVVPFGALLAAGGLDYMSTADTLRERRVAFVIAAMMPLLLLAIYCSQLPRGPVLLPVGTIPLVVAALSVVLGEWIWDVTDSVSVRQFMCLTLAAVVMIQLTYLDHYSRIIQADLLVVAACAVVWGLERMGVHQLGIGRREVLAVVTLFACHAVYVYLDSDPHTAVRGARASAALAVALGTIVLWRQVLVRTATDRRLMVAASIALAVSTLGVCVLAFAGHTWQRADVIAALELVAGLVVLLRSLHAGAGHATLAIVGGCALAAAQFTYFYIDYHQDGGRFVLPSEHTERLPFERLIELAESRPTSVIRLGPRYDEGLQYWRFYVQKHKRLDLLNRTVPFDPDYIGSLPPGSLAVTPLGWNQTDKEIDRMVKSGEMEVLEVVKEDSTPLYWILSR